MPFAVPSEIANGPHDFCEPARAGNPESAAPGQGEGREPFEARMCGREQRLDVRVVGSLGVELEQAIRQEEKDDAVPHRAQRDWVNDARHMGTELGGDLRNGMEQPVVVPELAQALSDDGPELAAWAPVNAAVAGGGAGDVSNRVAVELADGGGLNVPGEDSALRRQGDGEARRFGQTVRHSEDAHINGPGGGLLAPARARQRHQRRAEEENQPFGRHGCHGSFDCARSISRSAGRRNQKREVCHETHSSQG